MWIGPSRRRRVSQVVTVIMKTFQRPQTATRAVDHLRRRYPEIRLLVADDSSPALAFDHPGAEVVRLPFDSGVSKGRNALLERVETEYFLLMDDDNWFSRHTQLERMLAILERERFDILACNVFFRRHTERWFPKRRLNGFFFNLRLEDGTLTMTDGAHQRTRAWSVCDLVENFYLARTQRVREMGGWDERLKVSEHADFFLRAQRAKLKVGYTPLAGVDHVHLRRERASKDYEPFRADRQHEFRRIWIAAHGIQRIVDRDGSSLSSEEWIRRGEWTKPSRAPRQAAEASGSRPEH
ncbi:MAG: glycosyltransferase family 2 protein [Candidatus Limnocylindria bacterium]|jgi:glycosyltransferase involved in cell wall biosynthesis